MIDLLNPCRELAERQRSRMNASLARNETQTTWAGRALMLLGIVGVLGGLLSGYASARGRSRREALLSVRVRAVQAELDQDVESVKVGPPGAHELEAQLDRVVGRVKEVCQKLQDQERELLRAEQLAAVGHLAAGVAHEVRNPLTGIKLLVEAALKPVNPFPLRDEDLKLIRLEIVRMERTVQELLDYARTTPPDRRPHDIGELLTQAADASRSRADQKSIRVCVENEVAEAVASVDRDQMLSVLTNLLFNALEATPHGGEVTCRAFAGPDQTLVVEVTDTGPGIDPAVVGKLFKPFVTTKATGTGLGLSLAQRIARNHNGSLTAANRPEGGACFTLTLPR
jgi:two-component system sensor histidine kinase HydH